MSAADGLQDAYDEPAQPRSRFDPENWVVYEPEHEPRTYYAPMDYNSQSVFHILRGSCQEVIGSKDDGHVCGNDAAVRRVNKHGTDEYCLMHAPENWKTVLEGSKHIDDTIIDLRLPCEACVSSSVRVNPDEDESLVKPNRCGDRSLVLVSDNDKWSKAVCKTHAQESWLLDMRRPTGLPGNPRIEGQELPGEEEIDTYVDAPTGETYNDYFEWQEGVNGRYSSVVLAQKHLVCLDENGTPVRQ